MNWCVRLFFQCLSRFFLLFPIHLNFQQLFSAFCVCLSSYDEKQIREYFPLPRVLTGLFTFCEKLFGVQIRERKGVSTWHPDVQYFDILEPDSTAPVAGLYFDPYAR